MKYEERKQNLFELEGSYCLAHCISADFAMGKGIAVEFRRRGIKRELHNMLPDYVNYYHRTRKCGDCICVSNVYNLVTKERYFEKPTYESMRNSLIEMKHGCLACQDNKLAMPKIGCGLDGLDWNEVSAMIQDIFKDTDIDIVVCYLEE